MYPVYDLSTPGGKQALFQKVIGLSSASFAESLFTKYFGYGGFLLDPARKSEWFDYLLEIMDGGAFDGIIDEMPNATEENPATGSPGIYFKDSKLGAFVKSVDNSYLFRVPVQSDGYSFINVTAFPKTIGGVTYGDFTLKFPIKDGLETDGHVEVKYIWPVDIDMYPIEVDPSQVDVSVSFALDPDGIEIRSSYIEAEDYPEQNLICTPYGKIYPFLMVSEDTTLPISNEEHFGFLVGDGEGGSGVLSYGDVFSAIGVVLPGQSSGRIILTGQEDDLSIANEQSPNCPNVVNTIWGATNPIDVLKDDYTKFDWDHPITEPYPEDEPKGLSATKKHFIRVS